MTRNTKTAGAQRAFLLLSLLLVVAVLVAAGVALHTLADSFGTVLDTPTQWLGA
jgi:hypothetical protein